MKDISFAFKIAGEMIDPANIEDKELLGDINDVVGSIVDHIGDLACPAHHEAPRFLCTGENFYEISVETHGCCDVLIREVKKRLNF
ncbi:MAG: hypothetical protein RQ824_10970 [bacterium]|nr:hypothetical protein [bacterium]